MKDLFPVERLDAAARRSLVSSIDRELADLSSNATSDAPPAALYREPTDLPSHQQQLHQQAAFSPRLKQCLQRRLSERHKYLTKLAKDMNKGEHNWEDQVKRQEAVAVDRTELGHQPSTHHISSLLHQPAVPSVPSLQQPTSLQQPHTQSTRGGNRRLDVARSEEEMNRIIQSLLDQERDNPETRWLATAAIPPLQLAATSKCQFQDRYRDLNRQVTPDQPPPQNDSTVDAVWTEAEERIFIDRYVSGPKNFRRIAASLPFKTTEQCVRFYYRNKRRLNLKGLVQLAQSSASASAGNLSSTSSRKRSSVYASDDSLRRK